MRFGCWACLADFQSTTLVGGKVIILITFLFLVNDLCLASSIEILMDNPHRVSKNFCLPPWDHRSWYQVYQEQFKLSHYWVDFSLYQWWYWWLATCLAHKGRILCHNWTRHACRAFAGTLLTAVCSFHYFWVQSHSTTQAEFFILSKTREEICQSSDFIGIIFFPTYPWKGPYPYITALQSPCYLINIILVMGNNKIIIIQYYDICSYSPWCIISLLLIYLMLHL